jgi:hypothetical protein
MAWLLQTDWPDSECDQSGVWAEVIQIAARQIRKRYRYVEVSEAVKGRLSSAVGQGASTKISPE